MPVPSLTAIEYHAVSKLLELRYDDGQRFSLSAEYLRVHSPSAEVRGHGKGQEVLQTGKKQVAILRILPVGHYAVKLVFDDGHDSGIYSFETLYDLGQNQASHWQAYLQRLEAAGASREPVSYRPV
ncbi:MAG: DUF971 domain-containing protein [Gammaproteobacteria bacterium]|nr:DUF971 domain-containing protein [Gammaproteobacteria bacterium]